MPTVRIQEKNYSESIMVLKLKDGHPENERCDKLATSAADGEGLEADVGLEA